MAIIASHNGSCNKHRSRSVHHRELNHIYPVMVNTEPELRTILLQKVFFFILTVLRNRWILEKYNIYIRSGHFCEKS